MTAAATVVASVVAFAALGADPVPMPLPLVPAAAGCEGAAAAPSLAADFERAQPAAIAGCWTAPIGASFRFRVVDRLDVTIRSAEGGTQPGGALHAECEVTATVLDRRDGQALVRQQIAQLRFFGADRQAITGDQVQESFTAAAAEPVLVRIDGVGRVLGYGFASGLNGDQRNFLRGTLGLLACEAPAGGDVAWTSRVDDTTGEFEARHEVLPAAGADELTVRRTRVRYTAIAGHAEAPPHEVAGATEVRFATRLGWLRSVRVDEALTLSLALLDLQAITARRAEAVLIAADTVAVDGELAAMWAAADACPSGRDEVVGAFAADNERKRWQQRLAGVTLDHLLADALALLGRQPVDNQAVNAVFNQLQWLVKLDDDVAPQVVERLTTRQLAADVAQVVLGALGAAGTPAAQQALAAVRADLTLDESARAAATVACLQLARPDAAIVGGLLQEAGSESGLRGSSLLVLGALAPRTGELTDGRTPVQAILAMEDAAAGRGELGTWVLAVGNSKAPQTLAIAQRLFTHQDPAVRSACCVAIRGIAGAEALDTLVQRGLGDADPAVRHEAVLALARRSEPAARSALEQAVNDADESVRRRARRALGMS